MLSDPVATKQSKTTTPQNQTSSFEERKNLVDCLLYWEKKEPHATYLTQPYPDGSVKEYTWREVADQVKRTANWIRRQGLTPEARIGLLGKNSAHWIITDLAILMAGYVSVPFYPTLNEETFSYMCKHSEIELLFIGKLEGGDTDAWYEIAPAIPKDIPLVSLPLSPLLTAPNHETNKSLVNPQYQYKQIVHEEQPIEIPLIFDNGALATIIYTSGSTGFPKGVMISHEALVTTAKGFSALFSASLDERILSYLPLAHAAERAGVEATSLYHGFKIYFSLGLDTFLEDLQRARPTIFFSVPRLWTKFYQQANAKFRPRLQKFMFNTPVLSGFIKKKILTLLGLQDVKVAATGSAPLPLHILQWFDNLGLELLEVYGMTENFGYSHSNRAGDTHVGTVGRANPGVEFRIDENEEILVKSPAMMLGYYKNPEATNETITTDGFLRTGDMGKVDENGRLRITGRVKELFKTSKGKYVSPAPIENTLSNHLMIETVCVMGSGREQPFALAVLSEEGEALKQNHDDRSKLEGQLAELLKNVNSNLEKHEQLSYLVIVNDQWVLGSKFLTPTLKIKRSYIESFYEPHVDKWQLIKQPIIWDQSSTRS